MTDVASVRTACEACKRGCDVCFQAGRSHEVNYLKARLAQRDASVAERWEHFQLADMKVRDAYAKVAMLGARIHRLRERSRALHAVRIANRALQVALDDTHGELTPDLRFALNALDEIIEGEHRARRKEWEASQPAREPQHSA